MGTGSIGSIGSSISFWQQDQNYWTQVQQNNQAQSQSTALINVIGGAMTNKAQGLAGIANKTALSRVNSQLTAALQSALQTSEGGSASSSSSSPSSSSSSSSGLPAIGTGTVPLTANTSLLTLGIPATGAITVSDGTNTTTYASTGTDTVGDLLNALNQPNVYGKAQISAYLNSSGDLVVSGLNDTDPISVGGTFASDIGFGASNSTSSTSTSSSAGSTGSSSTSSSSSNSTGSTASTASSSTTPPPTVFNSATALQTSGTAEILLASSGSAGTLLNMLA
jgi:hypothetical protein